MLSHRSAIKDRPRSSSKVRFGRTPSDRRARRTNRCAGMRSMAVGRPRVTSGRSGALKLAILISWSGGLPRNRAGRDEVSGFLGVAARGDAEAPCTAARERLHTKDHMAYVLILPRGFAPGLFSHESRFGQSNLLLLRLGRARAMTNPFRYYEGSPETGSAGLDAPSLIEPR
jgi:hypothetical protein